MLQLTKHIFITLKSGDAHQDKIFSIIKSKGEYSIDLEIKLFRDHINEGRFGQARKDIKRIVLMNEGQDEAIPFYLSLVKFGEGD